MSTAGNEPITVGPDWDIHVGDLVLQVGAEGMRDFVRDLDTGARWVAVGANLVYASSSIVITPHINESEGSDVRRFLIADGDGSNLRQMLPKLLGHEPITEES